MDKIYSSRLSNVLEVRWYNCVNLYNKWRLGVSILLPTAFCDVTLIDEALVASLSFLQQSFACDDTQIAGINPASVLTRSKKHSHLSQVDF